MTDRSPSTPRLASTATAFPPNVVGPDDAVRALVRMFPAEPPQVVDALVRRSGVERRRFALPLERLLEPRDFDARQRDYAVAALALAADASRAALDRAGLRSADVDAVIDVSCTGVVLPALDVPLAAALGLHPNVHCVPTTEAGCAAGALALGVAGDFAARGARTLVVAVETCSLSLGPGDRGREHLVAGVLFGDGAAAAVVAPDGAGPPILGAGSHLFPGTSQVMGFDVGAAGLRLVLRRELPEILAAAFPDAALAFLAARGRSVDDVRLHLAHPGGRRVLETYAAAFGEPPPDLRWSWEALRRYGNLSSAGVLSVLDLAAEAEAWPSDGVSLLTAFGPGLSAEFVLFGPPES
ncbi:MAG TPA: 3-oxoacyl-[acyl-carrier-protein] synthase III C-terminal domain-containing protein [Planctomycetota bacterium]|nr:3-oxoacyl-[acyl-carrier-protein] synthase III C-terminal domain-containing protein [Planctomycetota bacterium]